MLICKIIIIINEIADLIPFSLYTHLCEAQFDTPLFEGLGKLFQFLQITRLLQSGGI